MPQQTAPPMPRRVFVPGVGTVTVQPGQTVQDAIAAQQATAPPSVAPALSSPTAGEQSFSASPEEFVKGAGKLILDGLILAGGTIGTRGMAPLTRASLQTAVTAPGGAARAALADENPVAGAATEAALNFGGNLGAHYIPRLGIDAALSIGGGLTRLSYDELLRARKAFIEQGERLRNRGQRAIPVGTPSRVSRMRDQVGTQIESLETASPARVPQSQLRNLTDNLRRNDVGYPDTLNRAITMDEARFMREQMARHGRGPYTVRELGNIRRDLSHTPAAQAVIDARINRQLIPAEVKMQGQFDAARADQLRDIQNAVEPRLVPANQEFSDLSTMKSTNSALRSGGTAWGDLGLLSMRGALGYGLGKMVGMDPSLSTALGWLLLSPANLSRTGFIGGTSAEMFPHAYRTGRGVLDINEESKKVRRRRPEEKK